MALWMGKNDSNRCLEEGLPKLGNLKPQAETRVRHEMARLFNPFPVKKNATLSVEILFMFKTQL
jgi:hypothetical protein